MISDGVRSLNILGLFRKMSSLIERLLQARKYIRLDKEALKQNDPSFESSFQFFFHAGFRSLRMYRIYHAFYMSDFKFLAYFLYHMNRILYSVDIHPAAQLEPGVVIDHGTGLVIGSTAVVGSGTVLYHGVTLGAKYITKGKRHPTVGRNVIIGAGAKVLGPITIGDGARIGANSVVIADVPENATAVGIPARIIVRKTNYDENTNCVDCYKAVNGEVSDGLCLISEDDYSSVHKEAVI